VSEKTIRLPHILSRPGRIAQEGDFSGLKANEIAKAATLWLGKGAPKGGRYERQVRVREAMKDEAAAARAALSLSRFERDALAAYRRYGGTADGTVMRLDLLARGALTVVSYGERQFAWTRWGQNPLPGLFEKMALLSGRPGAASWYFGFSRETQRPLPLYSLNAALAPHLEPAGPAPFPLPELKKEPQAEPARLPVEVALDLGRVFAYVAARGQVRLNKTGELGQPAVRALARAVPVGESADYPLPDAAGLYFELLREAGALRVDHGEARPDPDGAARLFGLPTARQAHAWARAWLWAGHWADGLGAVLVGTSPHSGEDEGTATTVRQVLAWALSCLAHAGNRWFGLGAFVGELRQRVGGRGYSSYSHVREDAWEPHFPEAEGRECMNGEARERGYWYAGWGRTYANALMVTLASLGLVQRGRSRPGAGTADCFRLTTWGRAVFGAPEVEAPGDEAEAKFLVVQPNFDVVAYLNRATAAGAATLGRLVEGESAATGTVRTFRITQGSIYRAIEGGLPPAQATEFLRQHSQNELPANVVRVLSDALVRRESLAVRAGLTVLGFPSTAERDGYLANHLGSACGERFVLIDKPKPPVKVAGALVSDHEGRERHTLTLDEHGRVRTEAPLDIVQQARLRRLAEQDEGGWRLTAESVRRAVAEGIKSGLMFDWLEQHLAEPMPNLLAHALDNWTGKSPAVELGELLLLHVPNLEQYRALAASERLRPLLSGSLGLGWLAVPREKKKELTAVLEELGLTVGKEVTPGPVEVREEPEPEIEPVPRGWRRRRW
jgi:hypothetical protein